MDLINRQDVIDAIIEHSYAVRYDHNFTSIENGMTVTGIKQVLEELPSAEHHNLNVADYIKDSFPDVWKQAEKELELPSAERKGKWIRMTADGVYWHECSECHEKPLLNRWHKQDEMSKFCPNCGARMVSEE